MTSKISKIKEILKDNKKVNSSPNVIVYGILTFFIICSILFFLYNISLDPNKIGLEYNYFFTESNNTNSELEGIDYIDIEFRIINKDSNMLILEFSPEVDIYEKYLYIHFLINDFEGKKLTRYCTIEKIEYDTNYNGDYKSLLYSIEQDNNYSCFIKIMGEDFKNIRDKYPTYHFKIYFKYPLNYGYKNLSVTVFNPYKNNSSIYFDDHLFEVLFSPEDAKINKTYNEINFRFQPIKFSGNVKCIEGNLCEVSLEQVKPRTTSHIYFKNLRFDLYLVISILSLAFAISLAAVSFILQKSKNKSDITINSINISKFNMKESNEKLLKEELSKHSIETLKLRYSFYLHWAGVYQNFKSVMGTIFITIITSLIGVSYFYNNFQIFFLYAYIIPLILRIYANSKIRNYHHSCQIIEDIVDKRENKNNKSRKVKKKSNKI